MRILQICSAHTVGGGETHLIDLSNSLADLGHDIFAALPPGSPVKPSLTLPEKNFLETNLRNAIDIKSAIEVAKFAKDNDIDLLHAHVGRDYPLAALASRLSKVPYVLTRHVLFPLKRLQKITLKNVGGVIAPSQAIADAVRNQQLFPPEKIETILHGINIEHFSSDFKTGNGMFTVGTVGHLSPIKGIDIFARAAKLVLEKQPEIRFVVVGEDKAATGKNRKEIENLITRLKIQDQVELAGWTDDIRPFFQDFDLFVSSAREEPFGLVMVEAMASKTPVLATRNQGALEIIEDGTSGLLVALNDPKMLAAKVLELYEDRELLNRIALNGYQRALQSFSLDKMVKRTVRFYESVLRQSA